MTEKLKSLIQNDQIFFSTMVLLVGVTSFVLGRESVAQNMPELDETGTFSSYSTQLLPEAETGKQGDINTPTSTKSNTTAVALVASKSGTRYHLEDCPGAKQIKESNIIRFDSTDAAEAAGYKPAVNCPGLQ